MTQQQESLIEFPCRFPVKVMGAHSEDFHQVVLEIARKHSPEVTVADLEMRVSKNGNYLPLPFMQFQKPSSIICIWT
jgi:putative lipoic acid-binding regulatory protein